MEKTTYIFGHKNPDTDSAVSAVSYAKLKELMGFKNFKAARAGHFNPQTDYIFKRFKVESPKYMPDLTPRVDFFLNKTCETVNENSSIWFAINKLEEKHVKALPVVDNNGKYKSLLYYSHFAQNVLQIVNPNTNNTVTTSTNLIEKTLNAQVLNLAKGDELFKAVVLVAAPSVSSFSEELDSHGSENTIVICSDRQEIHKLCIDKKIKLLILTQGNVLSKELKEQAAKNGVNVMISPYTTSKTVMLISYSIPVSLCSDTNIKPVLLSDSLAKIRPLIAKSGCRRLPVVDTDNKVLGVISEYDINSEPNIDIILVDHNEFSQAVEGIENYKIQEVIDHHRIGSFNTKYPITFINKPVGSTSTLITGLYREQKIPIPKEIASLLLCGILSDTLILQSTTTTEIDRQTAEYLSAITDLDIQALGKEILTAGSRIKDRSAGEVVHQDMKEYQSSKNTYTVSQIEVSSTREVLDRKEEFMQELEIERRGLKALFSSLLVTDITSLSSILLISCDPKFESFINFPRKEQHVYFLKDVVSRKKQLIPLISELVENFEN